MKNWIWTAACWLCCSVGLALAQTTPATEVLEKFDWTNEGITDLDLKYPTATFNIGQMAVNSVIIDRSLDINHDKSEPLQVTIRTLGPAVASKVTAKRYAITGTVKYEDVAAGSYLEMWSYFAPATPGGPEGAYFSRTLGDSGPMAKMEGTDEGHDFVLPFDATGTKAKLERLEFNLHLTGSGHVHLAKVRLVQFPDGAPTPPAPSAPANTTAPALPKAELMTYLLWWPGLVNGRNLPATTVLKTADPSPASWLNISHTDDTPLDLKMLDGGFLSVPSSFSNIIPTPKRYGIEGTVICDNVAPGSYLEMWSWFRSDTDKTASQDFQTRAAVEGSSTGRPFALPFDSTKVGMSLQNLNFNVHLAGKGNITLKDVKLVRYADPLPASATPPGASASPMVIGTVVPPAPAPSAEPPPMSATVTQVPDGEMIIGFHSSTIASFWKVRNSALPDHTKADVEPQTDPNDDLSAPLKITYDGSGPLQLRLTYWQQGEGALITTHHYAITGEVRCENVSPGSYLEMWSYFDSPAPGYPEGAYFSRTMADGGPMGKLDGTSDWREFWLPFDSSGTTAKLKRLEMNLHLTGPGTVHLRNLKLVQYPDAPPLVSVPPSAAAAAGGRTVIQITSSPNGAPPTLAIDGRSCPDVEALQAALTARHEADPHAYLVIHADKDVPYDALRVVLDMVKSASFANVAMETTPPATTEPTGPHLVSQADVDSARSAFKVTQLQYQAGTADQLELLEAGQHLHWTEAMFAGDRLTAARANHDGAQQRLELMDKMYRAGVLDYSKIVAVQNELAAADAEISSLSANASTDVGAPDARPPRFDLRCFALGVLAAALTLLSIVGLIFLSRLWQRRHHERELRRIASLDT